MHAVEYSTCLGLGSADRVPHKGAVFTANGMVLSWLAWPLSTARGFGAASGYQSQSNITNFPASLSVCRIRYVDRYVGLVPHSVGMQRAIRAAGHAHMFAACTHSRQTLACWLVSLSESRTPGVWAVSSDLNRLWLTAGDWI